jgi:hypothetical protein
MGAFIGTRFANIIRRSEFIQIRDYRTERRMEQMKLDTRNTSTSLLILFFVFTGPNVFAENTIRTILQVSNLPCGNNLIRLDARLKGIHGYNGMIVDSCEGLVSVDHYSSLDAKKLTVVFTRLGYPATIVRVNRVDEDSVQSSETGILQSKSCCGSPGRKARVCPASASTWKKLFGISSKD